jgi:ribosomal protein S18 acetylase RimI-like enzyme
LIADYQGNAHGFAHVAKWERVSEHAREELGADATFAGAEAGVVRFLAFHPGEPRVGQALLEEAERWFHDMGLRDVYLAYPYGFLRAGHAWLMNSMGHVCALFGINRYEAHERGVALRLPDLAAAEMVPPPPDVTTSFETRNSGAEGSPADLYVELRRGSTEVGSAYVLACGRLSSAAEAQQVYDLLWYNVDEAERGRGSGRHLLDATLREAGARGARTMLCYADEDNHVALRLYAAAGFKVDAPTYALSKQLDGG